MKAWVNEVNTTSFRIVVSVVVTAALILLLALSIVLRNWFPTEQQVTVLKGCGIMLAVMMGLDVAQFVGKRFSDATYAAAKNKGAPQVTVEAPSPVTVTGDAVTTTEEPTREPDVPIGPSRAVSPITRDD